MPLGAHVAITDEQRKRLEGFETDEDKVEYVNELTEILDKKFYVFTEDAWDAIHRCLVQSPPETEETPTDCGTYPLRLCIMGGKKLTVGPDWARYMFLIEPNEVEDIAKALAPIDEAWINEKYRIHCRGCWPEYSEDDMHYTWEHFQGMRDFFNRVAGTGRAVVFDADQ